MIVVQGGTGAEMYLVIEGRAFSEKNGYEKLIEYGPGQLFGELSALIAAASQPTQGGSSSSHSTPMRQATVTAHTDMMVMVLNAADITNRRNEAMAAGNKRVVECCGYALAAIDSILEIEGDVQKVTLETYRAAEKVAQTKKKAKADGGSSIGGGGGGKSPRGGSAAGSKTDEHGLWTTVANCWSGCIDYIGPKDPDYAYEDDDDDAEEKARNEMDAADAEVAELTNRAHSRPASARRNTKRGGGGGGGGGAAGNTPLSAEARSRPMVLAGLGPDATHGWEVGSGGLESTKRVWLPEFIARLRSVFIPLPRPEWIAARAAQQGAEVAAPGVRELSDLEKQAISDVWLELDRASTGSLPSSKLLNVVELVYGYELTHREQHALLSAIRYGGEVVDSSDISVTEGCEKRHFLRHLCIKMLILPRQARDKHRKS